MNDTVLQGPLSCNRNETEILQMMENNSISEVFNVNNCEGNLMKVCVISLGLHRIQSCTAREISGPFFH